MTSAEHLLRPLRRMREVLVLAGSCGQLFPGVRACGLLVETGPALEQVLEREIRRRSRRQRTERHIPQNIGTEAVGDPERRIGPSGGVELEALGAQRRRKTGEEIAISTDQRNVPLTWSRVARAVSVRRSTNTSSTIVAGPSRSRRVISSSGSADSPCRMASARPRRRSASVVLAAERRLVAFEQRDEIADEQRHVHGVGVAGDCEHFGIVERTAGLGCAIALLRAQMSAGQHRAGFVHFEPVAGVERLGDARGDSKVRRELLRQRALGGLDQPAGIANEHRPARIAVQSIEQALHLAKIALGVVACPSPRFAD